MVPRHSKISKVKTKTERAMFKRVITFKIKFFFRNRVWQLFRTWRVRKEREKLNKLTGRRKRVVSKNKRGRKRILREVTFSGGRNN